MSMIYLFRLRVAGKAFAKAAIDLSGFVSHGAAIACAKPTLQPSPDKRADYGVLTLQCPDKITNF